MIIEVYVSMTCSVNTHVILVHRLLVISKKIIHQIYTLSVPGADSIDETTHKIHPSTLRTLMLTTVNILRFYWHLYNQLLKVKSAFNFEPLVYVGN